MWEQELYLEFQYNNPKIFFHTFEAEHSLAGLSFAEDRWVTLLCSKIMFNILLIISSRLDFYKYYVRLCHLG